MEISIENLVIADPTIVDANPDIEENEGSDNEEAIVETGEAGTAPKKRKKKFVSRFSSRFLRWMCFNAQLLCQERQWIW